MTQVNSISQKLTYKDRATTDTNNWTHDLEPTTLWYQKHSVIECIYNEIEGTSLNPQWHQASKFKNRDDLYELPYVLFIFICTVKSILCMCVVRRTMMKIKMKHFEFGSSTFFVSMAISKFLYHSRHNWFIFI